jgi:RNA polymerase sigma-70 factor, ECF subfamily
LIALRPSIGALVSRACVLAEAAGVPAALAGLDELPADRVGAYQPYWAVRAHLLERAGMIADALAAYDMAVALAQSAAVKRYLLQKRARLAPS